MYNFQAERCTHAPVNSIFPGLIAHLLSMLCVLIKKNPFMLVEKNKQRLKGFEFGTFIGRFQMTPGSEGVSQASQQKQHSEVGPKH